MKTLLGCVERANIRLGRETSGISFLFFCILFYLLLYFCILHLGTKNSHAVMKFSDDTKSGDIINGKKTACGIEDLGFLVFYLQLSVAAPQSMYQFRIWLQNYTKPCDI